MKTLKISLILVAALCGNEFANAQEPAESFVAGKCNGTKMAEHRQAPQRHDRVAGADRATVNERAAQRATAAEKVHGRQAPAFANRDADMKFNGARANDRPDEIAAFAGTPPRHAPAPPLPFSGGQQ